MFSSFSLDIFAKRLMTHFFLVGFLWQVEQFWVWEL